MRRVWWVSFAITFGLAGAWALSLPLFSAPDEPAHTVRAVAVASGRIGPGKPSQGVPSLVDGSRQRTFGAWVPGIYARAGKLSSCSGIRPTADCPTFEGPTRTRLVETSAGAYPPAFYFVVGWPGRLAPSTTGVYGMRLVHAALCAALIASAIVTGWFHLPRSTLVGIVAAVTPMSLYLFGTVNPNGLEVASALLLWTAGAALVLSREPTPSTRVLVRATVAAAPWV